MRIPNYDFSISMDGQPLATDISHLFHNFPYDRLASQSMATWFMRPMVVVTMAAMYLASKPLLKQFIKESKWEARKSTSFRAFVAIHNLILALFSASTLGALAMVVTNHTLKYDFMTTYLDPNGTLWASGLGTWSTIFYLSKYYEFMDTWILICKRKEPSLLQVYHHVGVVLTMWGGVASQSAWLWIMVMLNSFIHTLMYTYFFVKTLWPKLQIPAARYLTNAQIGQFLVGILSTLGILIGGDVTLSMSSRFSLGCMHLYACGLIAMFWAFAKKKYARKNL